MKKDTLSVSNVVDRLTSPTPSFWKKVQKLALVIGAVSASIITAGAALPAVVVTVAGYAGLAAGTVVTVAQLTKDDEPTPVTDGSAPSTK
ncbi:hypothetical protein IDJ77_11175 [Mucilaginibacter sp. ZT4R22]|uniref:Holin n=1 Tax=Mucilaginibacter pankratovii TaxID=2772110 RepID=A0ABR7WPW3_9SPHI|nr:hypothetical protein [Mucilaginibacter pankratovii]MBD1364370.1 hypothetical protein [Mucilaginibacter pankratovii]